MCISTKMTMMDSGGGEQEDTTPPEHSEQWTVNTWLIIVNIIANTFLHVLSLMYMFLSTVTKSDCFGVHIERERRQREEQEQLHLLLNKSRPQQQKPKN